VRDEPPEVTGPRLINFLAILKFPLPPDVEAFKGGLVTGDRNAIYPVLEYVLSKFQALQKRAYLAKFLVNVDVPPEILHEEAVQEVYRSFKELQEEFKETHKVADKMRGTTMAPGELKREITQLTEEKNQLTEKIKTLQRRTAGAEGFKALLEATSTLRREQEVETKLQERMYEQRSALVATERRLVDTQRRLSELRSTERDDVSAEEILANVEKEYETNMQVVQDLLPSTIEKRTATLQALQRALMEPAKTEDDLNTLRRECARSQADIDRLQSEIAEANRKQGEDKLAMFRSQYALLAKKLIQMEEVVDKAKRENERLKREVQSKEARISEVSDPRFMKREDFKAFAAQLRTKTNTFKAMKLEMAEVQQELVVLSRTEQILKSRDHNVEDFLRQLEANKGILGYTSTQAELTKLSMLKATVDDTKGKTLNEISRIVADINVTLRDKKASLAPQIKDLRSVRLQYQELESSYTMAKTTYENAAAGLEAERLRLEQECNHLQEDCLREESRYHHLHSLVTVGEGTLERAAEETKFEAGEGRLLRDFKTWKDLYTNKVAQQQQLSNQLRKQQKDLKENSTASMEQRQMFLDLQRLLACKAKLSKEDAGAPSRRSEDRAGGVLSFDEIGGANVMTL